MRGLYYRLRINAIFFGFLLRFLDPEHAISNSYVRLDILYTVFLLLVFLLILAMIHHLEKKGTSFGKLVTIGTVSGALLGIFIQVLAGFPDAPTKVVFIKEATKWYSLVGGGFIDLIRMLVVPLVLTSIIHVILHMNEGTNLKKLVGAMLATNLGMVALAAIVGLSLGSLFGLGAGSSAVEGASKMRDVKPVVDTFRALIPMNPVKAMADTNVIAVVIFGVVIGGIAQLIKKTGSLAAERLGIAYGPVACPGAQLAIPIEPANGDEGEWRTVELSATLINLAAVAHDHRKVDDRRTFRMIRINGYLLLMRFHDGLLSVL